MKQNIKEYIHTIDKAVEWLLSQQNEDGSINPVDRGIATYYKVPWALEVSGHFVEALKLLDWVKENEFSDDGDFNTTYVGFRLLNIPAYPHAWMVIGAHRLGYFDISYKAVDYLLTYQDKKSGGFLSERFRPDEKHQQMDIMSTSMCIMACLFMGRSNEAKKAGDFLIRVLELQPDMKKLYVNYFTDDGLAMKFPQEKTLCYVIDSEVPGQYYSFPGAVVIALANLYRATHIKKYLDAAISYFNFTVSCRQDLYDFPPGGKLGWGSALLYKITGEAKYRQTAERIADYFVRSQTPAGHWPDFGEPYSGVAAEFIMWLVGIAQALT